MAHPGGSGGGGGAAAVARDGRASMVAAPGGADAEEAPHPILRSCLLCWAAIREPATDILDFHNVHDCGEVAHFHLLYVTRRPT
jgi:hypothetical protein